MEPVPIGSYRGFAMSLTVENFGKNFYLNLKGQMSHRVELGKDARGNLVRIDNALAQMPERLQTVQSRLENVQAQLATAKAELGKPFPQEAELQEKVALFALPDDAPAALLQITRPPRAIEVVERYEPVLDVHARAHFEGAAHEHTHLTGAHLCKQLLLSDFRIRLMDECDLLAGDSSGDELFTDVVVDGKGRLLRPGFRIDSRLQRVKLRVVRAFCSDPAALRRFTLRGGKVAEHELCQFVRLSVLPDAVDVVHAAIDLAVRGIRQVGVYDALIEAQLAPIRGNLEHIVLACVHDTRVNFCGALGQLLHHLLLQRRGLTDLVVVDRRRRGKV